MSATTDSDMKVKYDIDNKPGISNLITLYSSLTDIPISEIEEKYKDSNYGKFKSDVADIVVNVVSKIQARYNELINSKELDTILDKGRDITLKIAKEKYELVKNKIGLSR